LPACISCHRPNGSGIRPDFPHLAGQKAAYIEQQLTNWQATRGGRGKLMTLIVPFLRPADIPALAAYIAQLK
jgi:cytochrome c553